MLQGCMKNVHKEQKELSLPSATDKLRNDELMNWYITNMTWHSRNTLGQSAQ
jgi:hypothetical protein